MEIFGKGYEPYFFVFLILGSAILLFLTTEIARYLRPDATPPKPNRFNIPPGAATRKQINLARTAISQAEPEQALRHLSDLKVPALDTEITTLSSRYAEYRRSSRQGINSRDEENRTYNRITKDILDLIKTLESELATGTENYQTIKDYLKKRYTNRLGQKLAKRQPVNLRRLVNTEVLPEDNKPAFIEYKSEEISGALLQTFRDARGRLLLVGAPGAGKTTLLLQLVLELLEAEPDHLPVVLNLATWSKEYITLEGWLKKILAAEIGVSEKYAAEIIQQNRLIPLFDGFDEIREEDRLSCLEAINRYAEDSQRQYVISSRKQEFKEVDKAVVVHLPIEVCPLTLKQLKAELKRLWENPGKPERGAKLLLDAIEKDDLLREAIQTPFYFNTLLTLFNSGMTLRDLHHSADTLEDRQTKILELFIEYKLKAPAQKDYPPEKIKHWLSFLASRMSQRNMVMFELIDLQYYWWRWSRWQLLTPWMIIGNSVGLLIGLIVTLFGWLFFGLAFGVVHIINNILPYSLPIILSKMLRFRLDNMLFGIAIGPIIGLIFGVLGKFPSIYTKDKIEWSTKIFFQNFRILFQFGLAFGLTFGLTAGLKHGLITGLVAGLVSWLIVGLGGSFFIGTINILNNSSDIIQIASPYHRFIASMKALHFSILQHLLLRYQLYRQGLLPLKLVPFLNELSLRHILEFDGDPTTGKGGGAWRFRHRILQEWFAGRWGGDINYFA